MNISKVFNVPGTEILRGPYGSGHINDTYRVVMKGESGAEREYVLQRINTGIFKDPVALMKNICRVTEHVRGKILERGGDPARETLHFYPCGEGEYVYRDEEGCWRLMDMVSRIRSYNLAETPEMLGDSGAAFGRFMADLADFPAQELTEVIPDFHHTGKRYETFCREVERDAVGRAALCQPEIQFGLERKELALSLVQQLEDGRLPYRVTHNDTKINNVLMDADTGKAICVIDLDTVMPGACAYDFGDSIRFGASNALEDEKDLDKVYMRMDLFEAYVKGYLGAVGDSLTEAEKDSLVTGAKVLTYETGIRFLGDYLNGDTYFKIHRPEHNLDRARTQFKLVADMEAKEEEMRAIVRKYS